MSIPPLCKRLRAKSNSLHPFLDSATSRFCYQSHFYSKCRHLRELAVSLCSILKRKRCQQRSSRTWVRRSPIILCLTNSRSSGEPVIEQPTPKWQSHVLIYADTRSTDPEPERRLVAALNLDKLGWTANVKRLFGRRSQIYVMELPHQGGSRLIS